MTVEELLKDLEEDYEIEMEVANHDIRRMEEAIKHGYYDLAKIYGKLYKETIDTAKELKLAILLIKERVM